jgi:aminoglycoside N3'-acetyltransferase
MRDRIQSFIKVTRKKVPALSGKLKYLKSKIVRRDVKLENIAEVILNNFRLSRGDIVMVHTSLKYINLVDSRPEDLIHLLKMVIGTEGTLLMPVYARKHYDVLYSGKTLDIRNTLCSTGLINEVFRQMPDTIQSCHPLKSVAAWGRMACSLTDTHHLSELAFDENSPFYKLYLAKGKIIGIGVPLANFSFLHAIDDTNDQYFPRRYSVPVLKECIDIDGNKRQGYYRHNIPEVVERVSPYRISKYFQYDEMREFKIKGVPYFWADSVKVYNKTLSLATKGITIYR